MSSRISCSSSVTYSPHMFFRGERLLARHGSLGVTRDFEPKPLQQLHQISRSAQRGEMSPVHLVGVDSQALFHGPPEEVERKEAIVAGRDEPGGDVRPSLQGPGLVHRSTRLILGPSNHRLVPYIGRDVVKEN